jgi:hypothetical protein
MHLHLSHNGAPLTKLHLHGDFLQPYLGRLAARSIPCLLLTNCILFEYICFCSEHLYKYDRNIWVHLTTPDTHTHVLPLLPLLQLCRTAPTIKVTITMTVSMMAMVIKMVVVEVVAVFTSSNIVSIALYILHPISSLLKRCLGKRIWLRHGIGVDRLAHVQSLVSHVHNYSIAIAKRAT